MKIVLDTNILISAFITRGICSGVFKHCVRQHTLVTSEFILNEFYGKLVRKFKYSVEEAGEAVELIRLRMEVVMPADLEVAVCRDPDDDAILGTALAGDAACIVTGDTDLLVIERFRSIDIVRPSKFAEYEAT